MIAAPAFDRMAARYDELWTSTAIGLAQRSLVWRHVDPLFLPGDRILDLGCGTGADAAHFSDRGIGVLATDSSPAMVREAERRGGFDTRVMPLENIEDMGECFDGAISNFGALNCVADLPGVARGLASVISPGGRVAICTIGRFCLWESLYYACRLQFSKAFRRARGSASSSIGVTVYYPSVRELESAFAPHFKTQRWMGIGLLVPPSYVRLPDPLVRVLARIDCLLARFALLRAMADHRLLLLVRK